VKKFLYVLIDTSGSMVEMGKAHLQRNLCRFISQLPFIDEQKYANFEIHFFQWNTSIRKLFVQDNGDIPTLNPQSTSDLSSLKEFLCSISNHSQPPCVLLLSDGNFSSTNITEFKHGVGSIPNLILRIVAIGPDADMLKLKKLSTYENVYLAENISAAVNSIFIGIDEKIAAPKFVNQIKMILPPDAQDDWND